MVNLRIDQIISTRVDPKKFAIKFNAEFMHIPVTNKPNIENIAY